MSPLYVQPLVFFAGERLLAGIDHLGALCLSALHLLLLPAYRAFHVAVLAGVVYAIWDRLRAWRSLRRVTAVLHATCPAPGDVFWRAALAAGIAPSRVRVVTGLPNPAFTVGLVTPHVYLAQELAGRLTEAELGAVMSHEGAHLVRRDPLRLFALRLIASAFFWIPALRRLEADVRDDVELFADDIAARKSPLALASAILALANWDTMRRHSLAVGFAGDELLERRVRRLTGEETPVRRHLNARSVIGAAAVLSLVWSITLVVSHPLPDGSHETTVVPHCHEHHGSALGHLFCLRAPFSARAEQNCPHDAA
jgi:hypothetical protein